MKRLLTVRRLIVVSFISASGCGNPATPSTPPPFDGNWAGTYRIGQCVVTGWDSCDGAGTSKSLKLALTQTGSNVSGTANLTGTPIPVTGTVVNGTLALSGHVLASSTKASDVTMDLMQWASALTNDGRMQGTMRFMISTTWRIASSPFYPVGETWTETDEAEVVTACRTADVPAMPCR